MHVQVLPVTLVLSNRGRHRSNHRQTITQHQLSADVSQSAFFLNFIISSICRQRLWSDVP